MKYLLMALDIPVLEFEVIDKNKLHIVAVIKKEQLPFALINSISDKALCVWLEKRCIPVSRPLYLDLMDALNVDSRLFLSFKNRGLSLSDPFWIKGETESVAWKELNFYDNPYSTDTGDFLLGISKETSNKPTPDICTNGVQPKLWIKKDKDYLLKFSNTVNSQEPINEVVCSKIASVFPHLNAVLYKEASYKGKKSSACENFIKAGWEFVPAYYFTLNQVQGENLYYTIQKNAKRYGIHGIKNFLSEMIAFDYLINNIDRNLGNFGFIRDVKSNTFVGIAPLFDNGNSLWFDEPLELIGKGIDVSKPFCSPHIKQLALINKIYIPYNEVQYHLGEGLNMMAKEIDGGRLDRIDECVHERLFQLEYVHQKTHSKIYIEKAKEEVGMEI